MIYDAASLARLVTWFVFVFWDPLFVEREESQSFYSSKRKRAWYYPAPWVFGVAWGLLQTLIVASIYLFTEFFPDPSHWSFIVVTIFFLVQELIRKTWSYVFFRMKQIQGALVIAVILLVLGVALCFLIAFSECELRFLVMSFFIVYTAWLLFAVILNYSFMDNDEKSESFLPTTKSSKKKLLN